MQVCTDRSLSQRRQEQNLRTPTTPTPTLPQGLKMNPIPVHLSAFKPGTLLMAQTYFSARKQGSGTFCFRKLYSPFSCPTLSSLTEIQREVEPVTKLRSNTQEGPGLQSSSPTPVTVTPAFFKPSPPLQGNPPQNPTLDLGFQRHFPNSQTTISAIV